MDTLAGLEGSVSKFSNESIDINLCTRLNCITSNELYYCLKHNCRCLHAVALAMTIYLYDMASFNCNTFNSKLIDALTVSSDDAPEWTNR